MGCEPLTITLLSFYCDYWITIESNEAYHALLNFFRTLSRDFSGRHAPKTGIRGSISKWFPSPQPPPPICPSNLLFGPFLLGFTGAWLESKQSNTPSLGPGSQSHRRFSVVLRRINLAMRRTSTEWFALPLLLRRSHAQNGSASTVTFSEWLCLHCYVLRMALSPLFLDWIGI